MKFVLLLLVALCLPFAGCQTASNCDCVDCKCVDCKCVDCNCCNEIGQQVTPVDDSNKAYVTVFGDTADPKYQQLCQWGRQVSGVHYAEISSENPMFTRYGGYIGQTPRIVIQSADGQVLYKGIPATYGAWRDRFNNSCPDGNCRPRPEPAPAPAPSPAPSPVVEPVPDTPDSGPSAPIWLMILAGLGGAVGGSVRWWKQKYFVA